MSSLLSTLSSVYASGRPVKLDYNGVERLCVVEAINADHAKPFVRVKQLTPDSGYRTFTLSLLMLGSEMTADERNIANHYCQGK